MRFRSAVVAWSGGNRQTRLCECRIGGVFRMWRAPKDDASRMRSLPMPAILQHHWIGCTVTPSVESRHDPACEGPPLMLTGQILNRSDGRYTGDGPMTFEPMAGSRLAGIDLLIVTEREHVFDQQHFRATCRTRSFRWIGIWSNGAFPGLTQNGLPALTRRRGFEGRTSGPPVGERPTRLLDAARRQARALSHSNCW